MLPEQIARCAVSLFLGLRSVYEVRFSRRVSLRGISLFELLRWL